VETCVDCCPAPRAPPVPDSDAIEYIDIRFAIASRKRGRGSPRRGNGSGRRRFQAAVENEVCPTNGCWRDSGPRYQQLVFFFSQCKAVCQNL